MLSCGVVSSGAWLRWSWQRCLCWALFYCETEGVPNIIFSEHKLLAVHRLAFHKAYAKRVYVVCSVPRIATAATSHRSAPRPF